MSRRLLIPKDSLTVRRRAFLRNLSQAAYQPSQVARLLRKANPNDLKAIAEIAHNLLHKKFPVQNKEFLRNFTPHKNILRKLANLRTSISKKRDLLLRQNQTGGIGFLVPLLAPLLGTLISAGVQAAT